MIYGINIFNFVGDLKNRYNFSWKDYINYFFVKGW